MSGELFAAECLSRGVVWYLPQNMHISIGRLYSSYFVSFVYLYLDSYR